MTAITFDPLTFVRTLKEMRLETHIRESELKLEAKLVETRADLTRWVIGVGLLRTTVIVGVLLKVANLI